jgi:uncharacterized protein
MRGLWIPFQRDRAQDFATVTGPALLRAKVLQVLCTQGAGPQSGGELPWRTRFGAGLETLRHQHNDRALTELARVKIDDALRRWLPSVQICDLRITREDVALHIYLIVRQPPATEARLEVVV